MDSVPDDPQIRDNYVLCLCCDEVIPRKREIEHRRKATGKGTNIEGPPQKRQRYAFKKFLNEISREEDLELEDTAAPAIVRMEPPNYTTQDVSMHVDEVEDILTPPLLEDGVRGPESSELDLLSRRWSLIRPDIDVDLLDEEDLDTVMEVEQVPLEDGLDNNEFDVVDWEQLECESGLSALDQLGEEYEKRCAAIEKLDEYDRAICRAFAFKLSTHTTDRAWKKAPYAFLTDPPLPTLPKLRSRVMFLSGFKPELYDCCPNSCCCYVGPHAALNACSYCREPRYRADGRPRKQFTYIPLIPRLQAFMANRSIADTMQYRHKHLPKPGVTTDVFDGSHYRSLRMTNIELKERTLCTKYFEDARDVALGLSTDGFAPFNKRKKTAWPLIVFNYNLPPDVRFLVDNILALGVIPGPKKPHDSDSFLWPFFQELLRLMEGVQTYDSLSAALFQLRAFLILVFGDIPAIAMVMRMKGVNGVSPCRMCEIKGLRVPNSRATTHYVPLNQSPHPDVKADCLRIQHYQSQNLPLRCQETLLWQAAKVDAAITITAADELSKLYGIKGTPLLAHLPSIDFPRSFPYDFMHLIWENTIKNLVLLWTADFKGIDEGVESYELPKALWEGIGLATAESGSTIPSAYGSRVPNIVTDRSACTADMWSFWTLYLGPVLLRRRFINDKYYHHFIDLVSLLMICLQFEITDEEIEMLRMGFAAWVEKYEEIYYQHDALRLPTCPLTIHALLHIADSIKVCGPVWCYWAFPMERYCNRLKRAIRSRRFPYAALDRYVLEDAQLSQIKAYYDVAQELALQPPRNRSPRGSFSTPHYSSCILLRPRVLNPNIGEGLQRSIAAAISTRFRMSVTTARRYLKDANIQEWGKVRRVDSEEGDTMCSCSLGKQAIDRRDATFVRYEMLVDKFSRQRRHKPVYVLETSYGQLEHIFLIEFTCSDQRVDPEKPLIFAAIRKCILEPTPVDLERLDVHLYSAMGGMDVIDVTSIQALIGRVKNPVSGGEWAIIDRSGSLARAVWQDDDEVDDNDEYELI